MPVTLIEPVRLLHVANISVDAGIIGKSGFEGGVGVSEAVARREYVVAVGPFPVPGVRVNLFEGGKEVDHRFTDMRGRVTFNLNASEVGVREYVTTLLRNPGIDPVGLFTDRFKLGVWRLYCVIQRLSDVYPRYVGFTVNKELKEIKGDNVVGLMIASQAHFTAVVPVNSDKQTYVMYGISSPGKRYCLPYWGCWEGWYGFTVTCFNGIVERVFTAKLRGNLRLRINLTPTDAVASVVKA